MTFSATEASFEGFRLVRRHPLTIVFWSLAYAVFFAGIVAVFGGTLATLLATAEGLENGQGSPQELQALGQSFMGFFALISPLALLFGAILNTAVARSVLFPEQKALGYLRLGADELRVLAVSVLLTIVMLALTFVLGMVAGVLSSLAGSANAGLGVLVGLVVGLGAIAIFIWVSVRLSLAIPVTVAEKRIAPFASFSLTKGRTLPLLGMAVIAFLMSMLVAFLGTIIAMPVTLATGGGLERLAEFDGQSTLQIVQTAGAGLAAWVVVNSIFSALQLALLYAPFSAAYRDMKGLPHT